LQEAFEEIIVSLPLPKFNLARLMMLSLKRGAQFSCDASENNGALK